MSLSIRVCRFYRIKSIDEQPQFAHAAKATQSVAMQYDERNDLQWAWLFRAKELAEAAHSVPYSEGNLKKALAKLRALLVAPEELRQVPTILAEAGVRFVIVEFLPGAKIDGAAFWLNDTPVIALSIRFDRVNNFWFVLRHEIEHILNRDGLVTIDVELTERLQKQGRSSTGRVRANVAAAGISNSKPELDSFIVRVRPLYSEQRIFAFCKEKLGFIPGSL